MFGSKSKRIAELESDVAALKAVADTGKKNMARLRETFEIAETMNVFDYAKYVMNTWKSLIEQETLKEAQIVTLRQDVTNLEEALHKVQAEKDAALLWKDKYEATLTLLQGAQKMIKVLER